MNITCDTSQYDLESDNFCGKVSLNLNLSLTQASWICATRATHLGKKLYADVKVQVGLQVTDMDMSPKQSTEKYCKDPEVGNLVKEFYQAYRTVAEERYDQLLGQIHHSQPQLIFPSEIGFLCTESLPESPVCFNSQNLVRRKLFLSPRTPTRSHEQVYECHDSSAGGEYSPFSSISESDSDSKFLEKQVDEESKNLQEENEQLSRDLNNSRSEQKVLQKQLDKLQDELKALEQHNSLLHLEASSVQSEKSALVDEVERLTKANLALADNVAFEAQQAKNWKEELYICQQEKGKLLSALKEIGQREENFKHELKAKFQQLTQELISYEDSQNEGMVQHEQKSKLHIQAFHVLPHDRRESSEKVNWLHLENFEGKEDKTSKKLKLIEERSPDLQRVDHVLASQDERHPKLSEALLVVSETVQCLKQKLRHAQEALESSDDERYKMGELVSEMKRSISASHCNFISTQNKHDEKAKVKQLLGAYSRALFSTFQSEKAVELREHYDKVHLEVQQKILTQVEHEAHQKQVFELGSKGLVLGRLDGEKRTNSPQRELLSKQGSEVLALKKKLENNCIEIRTFQSDVHKLQASLWESKDQNNSLKEQMRELKQAFEETGWEMNKLRDGQNDKRTTVKRQVRGAQITKELEVGIWNENSIKQDEKKIIDEQLEASFNEIQRSVELQKFVKCIQIENLAFKSVLKRSLQTFCWQNEEINQATDPSDRNIENLDKDVDGVMVEIFGSAKARDFYLAEMASLRKESQEILRQFELRESHFLNIQLDAEKLSKTFSDSQQKNSFLLEKCEKLNKDKQDLEAKLALLQERTSKSDSELVISGIEGAGQQLMFNLEEHENGSFESQKIDTKLTIDPETERPQALTAHKATSLLQEQGSSKFREADDALADQERKLDLYVGKLQEENESLEKRSKDLDSIKRQHDLQEKEALQTNILQLCCVKRTGKERFTGLQFENSQLKAAKSLPESELCSSTTKMKPSEESFSLERERLNDNIKRLPEEKKDLESNIKALEMDLTVSWNRSKSMEETLQSHFKDYERVQSDFFEKQEMVQKEPRKVQLELSGSQDVRSTNLETERIKSRRQISLLEAQVATEQGSIIMLEKHIVALQQQNSQLRTAWDSGTAEMEVPREEKEQLLKLQNDSDLFNLKEEGCKVRNSDQTSRELYQGAILHVESQASHTIATDSILFQHEGCKQASLAETSCLSSGLFDMQPRALIKLTYNIPKIEVDKDTLQGQVVLKGRGEQNLANLPMAEDLEQRWRHPSKELTANLIEEEIQRPKLALSHAQKGYAQVTGKLEAELKLSKPVALDGAEVLQDKIISFEQYEVDSVQSTVKILKDLEDGLKSLKEILNSMLKLNSLLDGQLSTMAFQQNHNSENVVLVHSKALMLLEKFSKLSELTHTSGEKMKVIVDTFHKLKVSNLTTRDELLASARKEKAFKITMKLMRAEFFCLGQRIKILKEEKETQARQAELAMEAERKKSEEVISKLYQEMDDQEEQNRRQSELIIERGEEKREAIRQLSFALNYMHEDNIHLQGVIKSMKCKIYRRRD